MMFRFSILTLGGLLAVASAAAPASAQHFSHGEDQRAARQNMLEGHVMPFSIIKRKVEREMGEATYVGVTTPRDGIYRMQFLREDGKVVWVDVDGKTGNIIARTK